MYHVRTMHHRTNMHMPSSLNGHPINKACFYPIVLSYLVAAGFIKDKKEGDSVPNQISKQLVYYTIPLSR